MNRMIWIRAFRTKADKVELLDGRKFTIKYIKNPFYSNSEKGDKLVALVRPVRGYIPMGYFRMSRVTDKLWITESDRDDTKPSGYIVKLEEFLNSDLNGVQVDEQWPDLNSKTMETLRRGFNLAKSQISRKAENVNVVVNEGKVFLVKGVTND